MKRLNNVVDYLTPQQLEAIHGATDVTGFGLAGHGYQVAKASNVTLVINHSKLPVFDLSYQSLASDHLTKAHKSNHEYTKDFIQFAEISETEKFIYYDPQTSGGLLLSVAPEIAESILSTLIAVFPKTRIIGSVKTKSDHYVRVE